MKLIIIGCFVLFMFIVLFNLMSAKTAIQTIEADVDDSCSIDSSEVSSVLSEYDLYDDIHLFMTKQTDYIQSIMT